MDRQAEVLHLNEADAHIDRAVKLIDRQLEIIDELGRNGVDLTTAKNQLHGFEGALTTMLQHRTIIMQLIADIDRTG
jgi:hypothetical protein